MRRAGALAAAVGLMFAAAHAAAAVRVRTDTENRISFRLDGRILTVRPLLNARALWGERLRADCGTSRTRVLHDVRVWPRHARKITFRLPGDVSRVVRFCRFESAPTRVVIASVVFPRR